MPLTDLPPGACARAELFPPGDRRLDRLPGFQPLGDAPWLMPGPDAPGQRAERRRLLETDPQSVFATSPEGEGPLAELLARVAAEARAGALAPPARRPLDRARVLAELAVEDWALMTRDAQGAWVLSAGVICFPARWSLAAKLGRPILAIHSPVPDYDEELNARIERVFDRLQPGAPPLLRANWGLDPGIGLHAPPGAMICYPHHAPYLRVERQTLVKLPRSGAVAFGIRTQLSPLTGLTAAQAAALSRALAALSPAARAYKFPDDVFRTASRALRAQLEAI